MMGRGGHRTGNVYRLLQRHLDRQPVGYPALWSGADIRFLKRLFSADEARIALHLSYRPARLDDVARRAAAEFTPEAVTGLLESAFAKGAIARKEREGASLWFLVPLVVGMYEGQDGEPTREFVADAHAVMKTVAYSQSLLAVSPPQMRTIPIQKSLSVQHAVATYDRIRSLVETSPGPFVVLKCTCREGAALRKRPCLRTLRKETCLAMADAAAMILRRKHGREIGRDEALAILRQGEEEGLVLQPANSQRPDFVCSCCGCCCGMLSMQKALPRPLDFWTSNFQAAIDGRACRRCGLCVGRCQVGAVTLTGSDRPARIDRLRCIGCGLCVPTCPARAIRLQKKDPGTIPPPTYEALHDAIMSNRKGRMGQMLMLLKVLLRMRQ